MNPPSSLRLKSNQNKQMNNESNALPTSLKLKNSQKSNTDSQQTQFPYENENDLEREIERNIAQQTSRIGESVLGAPGDIGSFISSLFGKEQNILPTSQDLKNVSEKATLGYTKPKSESEEFFAELSSDIGSMIIPGGGHYSFARNIGVPIVGNLVKEGLKYGDSSEKASAYGKVGTMVALDLLSRKKGGVKPYMQNLFKKSEELIPKGVSVKATGLEKALNNLELELKKGGSRPSTTHSLQKISELKNDVVNGKIDVSTLAAYRPSINEAIESLGGFSGEVPIKYRPKAIRNLNQVKDEAVKVLTEYGEKFNPEFLKYHQAANESWAAYSTSNRIAKFLQDRVGYVPKSKAVQTLFDYGTVAGAAGLATLGPKTAALATTATLGYQTYKIFHRMMNSPVLRKYYSNVLKEAIEGNVSATTKNLKALDTVSLHQLESEEKENSKKLKKK